MNRANALAQKFFSSNCDQKEVDTLYLAIDYSQKTEWVNKHGQTVRYTWSWKDLLQFTKKTLMEILP